MIVCISRFKTQNVCSFSNKSETHYHYEYDMFHMFFQLFKVPAKSISVGQILSFIVPPSISCAI